MPATSAITQGESGIGDNQQIVGQRDNQRISKGLQLGRGIIVPLYDDTLPFYTICLDCHHLATEMLRKCRTDGPRGGLQH